MAAAVFSLGQGHAAQVVVRVGEVRRQGDGPLQVLARQRHPADVEIADRERRVVHVVGRLGAEQRLVAEYVVARPLQGETLRQHARIADREHLQHQLGHLVAGPRPEADRDRGIGRIARVGGRVVEREAHPQPRAGGQMDRFPVAVLVLPVEVPVVDPQQRLLSSVRQRGPRLDPPAQVVHVGRDTEHVDRDRQSVAVLDDVGRITGRDPDGLRGEEHRHRRQRRRAVREVESDFRLHVHGLASRQQVELQHQVRAGVEGPGDRIGELHRGLARRPPQEVPRREIARDRA